MNLKAEFVDGKIDYPSAMELFAMNHYETSATVGGQGEIYLAGVPFSPGTKVEVTISAEAVPNDPESGRDDEALVAARDRMRELFDTVSGFRNTPRIPREELYERGSVR